VGNGETPLLVDWSQGADNFGGPIDPSQPGPSKTYVAGHSYGTRVGQVGPGLFKLETLQNVANFIMLDPANETFCSPDPSIFGTQKAIAFTNPHTLFDAQVPPPGLPGPGGANVPTPWIELPQVPGRYTENHDSGRAWFANFLTLGSLGDPYQLGKGTNGSLTGQAINGSTYGFTGFTYTNAQGEPLGLIVPFSTPEPDNLGVRPATATALLCRPSTLLAWHRLPLPRPRARS
jgi:pimeloyl-ACP methyl ester carboxylesterase